MRKLVVATMMTVVGAAGVCASSATAQSALAIAGSLTPVGLQAGRDVRPDADLRLAGGTMSQIESVVSLPAAAGRTEPADPYRRVARLGAFHDFYPMADSGFHLTMGIHKRAQIGKMPRMSAVSADLRALLYSPPMTQALSARDGVKRKLPVALIGWTQALGQQTALRLDAGALAIRQSRRAFTAFADAGRAAARMGAMAQVSFIHRF